MSFEGKNYMVQIGSRTHIVLPSIDITQELQLEGIKRNGIIIPGFLGQKDGSRLKVIKSKRTQFELCEALSKLKNWKVEPERKIEKDEILSHLQEREDAEFYLYRMNEFKDSVRVMPVCYFKYWGTIVNLSPLMARLTPEDHWGVLIRGIKDLDSLIDTVGLGNPLKVIEHLPDRKMCPTCYRVYTASRPPKFPWRNTTPR